jgi:hypothetical protein
MYGPLAWLMPCPPSLLSNRAVMRWCLRSDRHPEQLDLGCTLAPSRGCCRRLQLLLQALVPSKEIQVGTGGTWSCIKRALGTQISPMIFSARVRVVAAYPMQSRVDGQLAPLPTHPWCRQAFGYPKSSLSWTRVDSAPLQALPNLGYQSKQPQHSKAPQHQLLLVQLPLPRFHQMLLPGSRVPLAASCTACTSPCTVPRRSSTAWHSGWCLHKQVPPCQPSDALLAQRVPTMPLQDWLFNDPVEVLQDIEMVHEMPAMHM